MRPRGAPCALAPPLSLAPPRVQDRILYCNQSDSTSAPKPIRVISNWFLVAALIFIIGNISDWQGNYSYYNSYTKCKKKRFHYSTRTAKS